MISWIPTLTIILAGLSAVQLRSLVPKQLSSTWVTSLGSQTPGITPLQSHLLNGIVTVIGSIHHDISSSHFQVDVLSFDSQSGRQLSGCQIPLSHISDRIWETRMTSTGFGKVVVSWLFNSRESEETGIRLLMVDTADCEYQDLNVTLQKDIDVISFIPHDVIGYDDGKFDLFVRSEDVCGKGVCRVEFDAYGNQIVKTADESAFTADDSLTWKIMPVEPSSSSAGFYHFAIFASDMTPRQPSQLSKLSSNGTVEKSTSIVYLSPEDIVGYSNSHGHLSFCSTKSKIEKVSCRIFDSQLKEISRLIDIRLDEEALHTKKMSVANVVDGTVLVLLSLCEDTENVCERESTLALKVKANGDLLQLGKFPLQSGEGCFPRKSYDVFEIASQGVFCASKPCMSKRSVDDKAYDVSLSFQCYNFVQADK